jgi:pimeloyl-ACP methyl ester carboxylesterase
MMEHTLEFADGRTLSYTDWGPEDAATVLYFHGFPSSRHELELTRPGLERNNLPIRVVALDRPGFGASTDQPGRGMLDWPDDVAEAADLLGIDRFAVLGVSAGGPYVLACGYALPDRVTRVGVVVGIAPMAATGMDDAPIAKTAKNRWFRRGQFAMLAFSFSKGQEDKFVAQAMATMGEADQRALEQAATRNSFIEMARGAFTQGGSAATVSTSSPGDSTPHTSPCRQTSGMAAPTTWCPPPLANGSPTAFLDRATPSGRTTGISPGATATKRPTYSPQ